MQRDNLERFIMANREDFDQAVPSLKVWAEIDKELEHKGRAPRSIKRILRVAAAVAVLLITGALGGNFLNQQQKQNVASVLNDISPQINELEQYYNSQFEEKYQQLVRYQHHQAIQPDLEQLDQVLEELKKELVEAPEGSEEQIVNNLIRTYQIKIQILERVLEKIQSTNRKSIIPRDDEISI